MLGSLVCTDFVRSPLGCKIITRLTHPLQKKKRKLQLKVETAPKKQHYGTGCTQPYYSMYRKKRITSKQLTHYMQIQLQSCRAFHLTLSNPNTLLVLQSKQLQEDPVQLAVNKILVYHSHGNKRKKLSQGQNN